MQGCELLRFFIRLLHGSLVGAAALRSVAAGSDTHVVLHDVVVAGLQQLERVVKVLAHRDPVELHYALHRRHMEGNCVHHAGGALLRFFHAVVPHP